MHFRQFATAMLIGGALILAGRTTAGDPAPRPDKKFAPVALGMEVPVITSTDERDKHVGRLVAVRGTISNTKRSCIVDVEVDAPDELRLREAEAYAVGILTKYTVTKDEIRKMLEESRKLGNPFGVANTGPGVYYALCVDLNGKRSKAQLLPKGDGK